MNVKRQFFDMDVHEDVKKINENDIVGDLLFSKKLESQDDIASFSSILQEKLESFKQLQVVLFRICKGKNGFY